MIKNCLSNDYILDRDVVWGWEGKFEAHSPQRKHRGKCRNFNTKSTEFFVEKSTFLPKNCPFLFKNVLLFYYLDIIITDTPKFVKIDHF